MKLGHRHQCDQCGKVEPWNETWARYSSIAHDETCPDLMPELCSDSCRERFTARLERGEVRVPKLRNRKYYFEVREGGRGYGVFAMETKT